MSDRVVLTVSCNAETVRKLEALSTPYESRSATFRRLVDEATERAARATLKESSPEYSAGAKEAS